MNQINLMIAKTFVSLTVVTVGHETVFEPMLNLVNTFMQGTVSFINTLPLY